jgi:hypothetical protein
MMRRLHPRASELQQKIPVSTARVDEISVTDSRENYDCPIASQMGGESGGSTGTQQVHKYTDRQHIVLVMSPPICEIQPLISMTLNCLILLGSMGSLPLTLAYPRLNIPRQV